ncbi:FHA domain-containing protein [Nocardia yunnanensis]|uniref:FHA domain-containing protein n=1 Tax=Nocardia yunnanensis TaxID=2382165 RepID=A0A386ZH59_9NOCA|nr:FHA domain-containing protein [Nocardia yunnanensis]AYF75925.1 FHA domain-containing protein [Nocardia yunnanensis]
MAVCSEGHESTATDYCDVCGAQIGPQHGFAAPQTTLCPACGAPSEGRFCENCGHDSALPPPPAQPVDPGATVHHPDATVHNPDATVLNREAGEANSAAAAAEQDPGTEWVATVTADAGHYARMRAQKGPDLGRVDFPDYYPDRRIPLVGPTVLIGKRSVSQGVHPDIDLSVAPADLAVSRSHAILHIDGGEVTVTDLGSTNGTCLNDSAEPIPAKTAVPLRDGDRIHVGGWTTITVLRVPD